MRKTIFILAFALLIAGTMITGCQSSAAKVENANDNLAEAKDKVDIAQQELNLAIKDSIQQFKKESEEKIAINEQNIDQFKVRIAKENDKLRAGDERRLAELEHHNREMKQQLADFNGERGEQWASFRDKFNRDMENQRTAFKNFWGIRN